MTLIASLILFSWEGNAQKLVKGLIVDSLSLDNVAGVHVIVKNSNRATVSDTNGIFTIMLYAHDTLVFSSIGYSTKTMRAYIDDDIMFVRMHEESIMLKEIVIRDRSFHFNRKIIHSQTLSTTKPLPAAGINLGYFSKAEKEKRKLVAVIHELERVRIYVDIVNDRGVREDIMERNSISEARFYDLLAAFNQRNSELMHSGNEDLILSSLFGYFEQKSSGK